MQMLHPPHTPASHHHACRGSKCRAGAATGGAAAGSFTRSNVRPAVKMPLVRPVQQQLAPGARGSTLQEPPGPPLLLPLIGEMPDLLKSGVLRFGLERMLKYGPVYKTNVLGMDVVSVCDPELYKAMMLEDSKLVNFEWVGSGARLQDDARMRGNVETMLTRMGFRKLLLPAMSQDAMAGYMPKMLQICTEIVHSLESKPAFEVNEVSRKIAMQLAYRLLAGIEMANKKDEEHVEHLLHVYLDGLFNFDINLPGSPLNKALKAKTELKQRISEMVDQQLVELLKEPKPVVPGHRVRQSAIGYVVDGWEKSHGELITPLVSIMAMGLIQASTDTVASGLSCLLAILVQRPDVWERLRAEQAAAIQEHGPAITKASLDGCKFLDACVRESLRYQVPVPWHFRKALVDFELGGYLIKQGTTIMPNLTVCQALEAEPNWVVKAQAARAAGRPMPVPVAADLTRTAEGFDPDRWLAAEAPSQRPSLLTFSYGPHTCVGMALYVQEAKVLLAYMLRKYNLRLVSTEAELREMLEKRFGCTVNVQLQPLAQPLA